MSKSNVLEQQFIEAVFAAGAVSPNAILYVALHTADPGEGGNQATNEATFAGYARQAVAVPAGWSTGVDNATNVADIIFPEATAGTETLTHFSIGNALSGAGSMLYFGSLTTTVDVVAGVTVKINATNLVVTED